MIPSDKIISSKLTSSSLVFRLVGQGGAIPPDYNFLFNSLQTTLPSSLTNVGATYTRAGTKYNLQNSLYVAYGANAFGTNYDVSEAAYGYYPELLATNLWTYSIDFSNAAWVKNLTEATNIGSPFSGGASFSLTSLASNTRHFLRPSILADSGVLSTFSFIVKANGLRYVSIGRVTTTSTVQTWVFDLQDGDIFQTPTSPDYTNGKIVSLGAGWYRISVNVNSTTAAVRQCCLYLLSNTPATPVTNANSTFLGDGVVGILCAHAQLETGGRASSPIITTSSTVTRAADVLSVPRANLTKMLDSEYAFIVDHRSDITPTTIQALVNLTDTISFGEFARLYRTDTLSHGKVNSSTFVQADITSANVNASRSKIGLNAQLNNFILAQDGAISGTDVSGTMPISPTELQIGHIQSLSQLSGHIYSLIIKNTSQTQTQLEAATA